MAIETVPEWMAGLEEEDVEFIRKFLLASGSLKEMAGAYGVTYPTVRLRLDRLIPEFKDAVDKGTLAMVAAVDLSYLNVKMQKMIQQVAEAEGKKLKPKQAVELRKMGKEIMKEAVESVLAGKEQKKPQSVSVKLPVELYERYFGQMDAGAVQEIMEKALEGYFGKEAPGV